MKVVSVRFPDDVHSRLVALAAKENRSVNGQVIQLVQEAVATANLAGLLEAYGLEEQARNDQVVRAAAAEQANRQQSEATMAAIIQQQNELNPPS